MLVFFFNDTATTEIYTLSLHDALPIFGQLSACEGRRAGLLDRGVRLPTQADPVRQMADGAAEPREGPAGGRDVLRGPDRKSTRLNSSHANISYAVFCLKKKIFR